MKVLIAIYSLATANGGPTRSAKGLAKAIAAEGVESVLLSHIPGTVSEEDIADLKACGVKFREGRGIGVGVSMADSRRILAEERPDVVHIQGLWTLSTHSMNVAATRAGIKVVISPRGMLAPWALNVKKWKKRLGLFLYQRGDLKRAAALHATAEQEAEDIRSFGLVNPLYTIPNGVTFSGNLKRPAKDEAAPRTALFLSRLHPDKGLMLLAEAWAMAKPEGWRMVVAGPNVGTCREDVEARLKELGIEAQWEFKGEVGDREKWDYYTKADLLIHPSKGENFCLSIAEALGAGLPVITTKGCPWAEIEERKCGWWIERDAESLAATLREAIALTDSERAEMGKRARALIHEKYSWDAIGKKMKRAYEEVAAHGGALP